MDVIERDAVMKILEETKTFVLKTGHLDAFGALVTILDRVKKVPVYRVAEKQEEKK